jgi:hypothetical protein
MCTWKNYVVLSGGLNENEDINEEILLINTNTFEIKQLIINDGFILPR